MRRRAQVAVSAVAVAGVLLAATASSTTTATATGASNGSSYAAAAFTNAPSGSLAPVATVNPLSVSGGLLGPVLSLLGVNNLTAVTGSLLTNVANPLVASLTALPQSALTGVTNGLTGAGLSATNPSTSQPIPAAGTYPTCGQSGWTTGANGDCYGPTVPGVSVPSVITVATGATQGWAAADQTGYASASKIADPVVTLLGVPLGDLGVITASSQCGLLPNPNCTGTQKVAGMSLLGGAITATVADGSFSALKVNNLALPAQGTTLTNVLGLSSVGVKLNGQLLTLSISLNLTQLLTALGTSLGALTTALGLPVSLGDTGTTATLTVNVGPSAPPTAGATSANAYGIALTSSLTADIKLGASVNLGLLGVVNLATVEVKTAALTGQPNLLDVDLGYSASTAGPPVATWIAPGAI